MKSKYSYRILSREKQNIFKLEDIKNYIRISNDNDDELLQEMVDSAIETAENFIKSSITQKTIEVIAYNTNSVKLPIVQLVKMIEVKADGKLLQSEDILVFFDEVMLSKNSKYKEIIITYISGYANNREVPAGIKQAIMLHTAQMYDNRGSVNPFYSQMYEIYKPYRKMVI